MPARSCEREDNVENAVPRAVQSNETPAPRDRHRECSTSSRYGLDPTWPILKLRKGYESLYFSVKSYISADSPLFSPTWTSFV